MSNAVLDLLAFYQQELAESEAAQKELAKLGISAPGVVERFRLGYCSGRALKAASEAQYQELKRLKIVSKRIEKLHDCVVIPILDANGQLVDLCGVRQYNVKSLRHLSWQVPSRGLIGGDVLKAYAQVFLTDNPLAALHVAQLGFPNVVAVRKAWQDPAQHALTLLKDHLPQFEENGVRKVYLISRKRRSAIAAVLEKAGIEVEIVSFLSIRESLTREVLEELTAIDQQAQQQETEILTLVSRTDNRLTFEGEDIRYRVESLAGLGMRATVRAEAGGKSFIDRLDLASAGARRKFAKMGAGVLNLSVRSIERHVSALVQQIDDIEIEGSPAESEQRKELTGDDKDAALSVLKNEDVLQVLSDCMAQHFHFIGEQENRKLALLVAASRLLPKPLGAIIRGPASSGKSELIRCTTRVLPSSEVLSFSRLTPQALYFLPPQRLEHRLMVVDEYAGLQDAEHALRTMMSSQSLSLAITVRDSGKVPVTRTIEIPATLAVMVSTTLAINIENLSRFIELKMDDSPQQTRRVMQAMASGRSNGLSSRKRIEKIEAVRDLSRMLKPCSVSIPFADRLIYSSTNVLARRQFAQVVGLVSAHAALFQHQRQSEEGPDGLLRIIAEKADYEGVFPLLAHVVDTFEEEVSPAAMELLDMLQGAKERLFTRKEMMKRTGWSYTKLHRELQNLERLNLMIPDTVCNGVERVYEVAPYFRSDRGVNLIAPPEAI